MTFRSPSSSPEPRSRCNSTPSEQNQSKDDIINMLKRRLDDKEHELADEKAGRSKRQNITTVTLGRGVRRLVSCFANLTSLVAEADQRGIREVSGIVVPQPQTDTEKEEAREQDRAYTGYQILVDCIAPHVITLRQGSNIQKLRTYLNDLQRGGNSARADDNSRIRIELAKWLNNIYKLEGEERLNEGDREGRGLQHDVCGKLLTPITVDWDNLEVRDSIRNGTGEDVNLNAVFFLRCLYPPGSVNMEDPLENFLRGPLLLRTYHSVFISPSIDEEWYAMALTDDDDEAPPISHMSRRCHRKSGRKAREGSKGNVAGILKMNGRVTPRSIAYAATLLVFNLTDASVWDDSYNGFSFHGFYNFLVDFFEDAPDADMKAYIRSLLSWWNKQIFPAHVTAATNSRLSYQMLAQAWARRVTH